MELDGCRRSSLEKRQTWLIVGVVALTASIFRFAIARYSLWFDEQASMYFAQQPLAKLWSNWMLREPNPPLYYSLLKYCIHLFGDSERAVRILSIAAGAGSIVTTAVFAEKIYGGKACIMAAILTALSTQQLYYSLQVRSYELAYLAASGVLISLVSIERGLRLNRAWTGSLVVYACCCTIAIYLHTTMFLLPVICTLSIMVVRRREWTKRPLLLLPLMAANLATALATGWWLDITVRQMMTGAETFAVFGPVTPWLIIRTTIGTLSFVKNTGLGFTLFGIIFTTVAIFQVRKSWDNPDTKLLVCIICLSIAIFIAISIKMPIFLPRTIFWLSIITTAFCAAGITQIDRQRVRRLAILGFGSLVALNMATSVGNRETENWDGAIIRAERLSGSKLIVEGETMALLLKGACSRLNHGACPVPIIAVTTPYDKLDKWSIGQYSGFSIPIDRIDELPNGKYFIFRKERFHNLLDLLHVRVKASSIRDDTPLVGPVDRSALIE